MYKLLGLANIKDDASGLDHGDCPGLDSSHFLRHRPSMAEVHVGRWREHMSRDH